ncbi:MAG TPA: PQQ-binding-like beta-propeller repeat protein [Planctomycetota bacterium]|nr:PQQ-binding-like beta-propeller repeat protein [Planctomycetota bacterium]
MTVDDFLFVAFNRWVVALRKDTGEIAWEWRAPSGMTFTAVLIEDNWAYVSSSGYTYCLDALTGTQIWANDLPGKGTGVPCLATKKQSSALYSAAAAQVAADAASSSSSAATVGGGE